MGADYSFDLISIVHWVPQFFVHNKSDLGGVKHSPSEKMSSIVKSILQIEFTPGRILYATQIVRVHVSNILLQEGCTNSNYPPQIWTCSFIYVQKKLVSVQKQVYYNNLCSEICWIINSLLYKKEMFLEILAFYASSLNSRVWKLWNFLFSVFLSFVTKGQTISEWIYEVIVSPKIRTKNCQDFCPL